MSDTQNDLLIQEVDDEVRRARLNALWKAWGKYIIGAAVLVVLVVAGRQYWMSKTVAEEIEASNDYNAIIKQVESGEADPAGSWAASLDSAEGGYKALGAFRLAAAELEAGNIDSAIAAFDQIAASSDTDDALMAIANLQAASLQIQQGDYAGARGRAGLLVGDDSSWDLPARELIALADLQEGKIETALVGYRDLNSGAALPPTMADRVAKMVDYLEGLQRAASSETEAADADATEAPASDAEEEPTPEAAPEG